MDSLHSLTVERVCKGHFGSTSYEERSYLIGLGFGRKIPFYVDRLLVIRHMREGTTESYSDDR